MDSLQIYPGAPNGWSKYDPRGGDEFGYYSGAYEELRNLVLHGAERGLGLMIWLS
ncbi:MAG: hypothetical protein HYV09_11005 [Deltaproteobacteria bacterium]|nr:hypothetical protein [Deltaproteobacteria bacterium]